jgi:cytochrome P450
MRKTQLLQFMAAGHETSANALAWSIYVLVERQDIQAQLRAEIEELARQNPELSFSDIDNLTYLNNFIREVLRFYPPGQCLLHPWIVSSY